MAHPRQILTSLATMAAASLGAAAFALWHLALPAAAQPYVGTPERTLASELRIVRGDLAMLDAAGLPAAHREGLEARLLGALGVLPWLLTEAGDAESAMRLFGASIARPEDRAALARELEGLLQRHQLDLVATGTGGVSAKALLEARAIHENYCAGCHDGAGAGDPDLLLPTRDLFEMARTESEEVFVARLYSGIKGDETIGFRNPLTEEQFLALWRYYATD